MKKKNMFNVSNPDLQWPLDKLEVYIATLGTVCCVLPPVRVSAVISLLW